MEQKVKGDILLDLFIYGKFLKTDRTDGVEVTLSGSPQTLGNEGAYHVGMALKKRAGYLHHRRMVVEQIHNHEICQTRQEEPTWTTTDEKKGDGRRT
jgi:hypothetical protein